MTKQKRENDVSFDGSNGSNPIQCNLCHKVLCLKSSLKRHKAVHTGEKKHVCTTCGRSFVRKDNLNQHMVTHSDEKP